MLSDLHNKQVRGLEAEVANAREQLSRSRLPSAEEEPRLPSTEDELGGSSHVSSFGAGSVDPVHVRGRSRSRTAPAGPQRRDVSKVGHRERSQIGPRKGTSTKVSYHKSATEASQWADELSRIKRVESFMNRKLTTKVRLSRLQTMTDNTFGEGRKDRLAYKMVKTVYFDALSYVLIIANSLFIGASMEHRLSRAIEGRPRNEAFDVVETAFVIWFIMELLLKFLAEDVRVLLGPDRMWNLLDLALVASAIGQQAMESGAPNVSFTRNVRLVRVVSILRLARVVRICRSLRVMIFATLRSLDSLFWVLVVLAFFMYIFAMAFMHAVIGQFQDNESTWLLPCPDKRACRSDELECPDKCAHLTWLDDHFGSLPKIMLTLFQSITNGRDWAEVYDELHQIHGNYSFIFVVFIYFMVFLVLNVVIGTVVDVTSGVSKRDRDNLVKGEMKQLKEYTHSIKQFFLRADSDSSGHLSLEEFTRHLEDPKVKAYFNTLDLDTRQADVLFTLLDQDETGEVGISEFLDGCLRLKGGATNLDMNLVLYQLDHLLKESQQLLKRIGTSAGPSHEAAQA
jgi:hypothetical protein